MPDIIAIELINAFCSNFNNWQLQALLPVLRVSPLGQTPEKLHPPLESFSSDLVKHVLEDGESFVDRARDIVKNQPEINYFVVTPLLPNRKVSESLKKLYPRQNLEQIALTTIVQELAIGSIAGFVLPKGLLLSRSILTTLDFLRDTCTLRAVIEGIDSVISELYGLKMMCIDFALLLVERGVNDDRTARFFRIPELYARYTKIWI